MLLKGEMGNGEWELKNKNGKVVAGFQVTSSNSKIINHEVLSWKKARLFIYQGPVAQSRIKLTQD